MGTRHLGWSQPNLRPPASALVVAVLAVALLAAVGCAPKGDASGAAFTARKAGVLTVATAFVPAPGFWVPRADGRYDGFEAAVADELARRLDLQRVDLVQAPFADIAFGRLGDADIALSQVTPTEERSTSAAFSTPYLSARPGVLVRAGTAARDLQAIRSLRWVVVPVSTLAAVVTTRIRPLAPPTEVPDRTAALDAISGNRADAVLLDLPVALAIAKDDPGRYAVAGQLSGDEGLAVVLPKRSPNADAVDAAIKRMRADGTLDRLAATWLGTNGADVPLIRTTD